MKQSAAHKWLLASVMGILWAIATAVLWALLALAFGRSKSDLRLITMLILGAVIATLLGAHAYSEGWKGGNKATVSRKDPNSGTLRWQSTQLCGISGRATSA